MKKYFITIFLLSLITIGYGQEFIGIKVEGKINEVVEKFKLKGLRVTSNSTPNIVTMKGFVANKNIELNIVCTPKSKIVWKFGVYLPVHTTWASLKDEYQEYLKLLTNKYGEPTSKYNFFSSPYEEGDGFEMTAVAVEKCTYSAFWPDKIGIYITISEWKQVKINYENSINADLDDKENEEINKTIFK